jgi:hypothetical protein
MKPSERVIILKPHPMGWLYLFVICVLAIPLFGAGLVAGFFLLKHIRSLSYHLSDSGVELHRGGVVTSLRWDQVSDASAVSRAGRLGHVVLHTAEGDLRLLFLEDAFGLAETIQAMLKARKAHQEERFEPRESETGMGNDRLNDLTALWQQGLISEEDYLVERKHFM